MLLCPNALFVIPAQAGPRSRDCGSHIEDSQETLTPTPRPIIGGVPYGADPICEKKTKNTNRKPARISRLPPAQAIASDRDPSPQRTSSGASHSTKAASNTPTITARIACLRLIPITARMICLRLMRHDDVMRERAQCLASLTKTTPPTLQAK